MKLSEIDERAEFWSGTKLRKYNVGLNTEDRNEDYYDYILAYANWDKESMMLVNITEGLGKNKAGSVYSGVLPIKLETGKAIVNKASFLHTLEDIENWYILYPDL